jgi:hypothetical protein
MHLPRAAAIFPLIQGTLREFFFSMDRFAIGPIPVSLSRKRPGSSGSLAAIPGYSIRRIFRYRIKYLETTTPLFASCVTYRGGRRGKSGAARSAMGRSLQ